MMQEPGADVGHARLAGPPVGFRRPAWIALPSGQRLAHPKSVPAGGRRARRATRAPIDRQVGVEETGKGHRLLVAGPRPTPTPAAALQQGSARLSIRQATSTSYTCTRYHDKAWPAAGCAALLCSARADA